MYQTVAAEPPEAERSVNDLDLSDADPPLQHHTRSQTPPTGGLQQVRRWIQAETTALPATSDERRRGSHEPTM